MPRLRSGLETGETTEGMDSLLAETFPPSPVKNNVDEEMVDLEHEFKKYNERAALTSQVYLNLLIKSYQDQIDTLKEELKEKNKIIFDILNAGSITIARGQPIQNVDMTIPEVIPTLPQTNSSPNVQEKANKSVVWTKCKGMKTVSAQTDESKAIQTCNRFSSLADNEWVKSYDNESVFDIDECVPSSSKAKEVSSVKRRPNVVVEQNPEVNTISPYRKRSEGKGKRDGKRSVAILGDSMIRNIHYRDLSKSCPREKIYVKAFPGADVQDMCHYSLPTAKRDPDTIFLHCGTNSLQSSESPEALAKEIVDLATSLKTDENEVIISSIISRSDDQSEKVKPLNDALYAKCLNLPLGFMDNNNIQHQHLSNRGRFPGLHLNDEGNKLLFDNIVHFINM